MKKFCFSLILTAALPFAFPTLAGSPLPFSDQSFLPPQNSCPAPSFTNKEESLENCPTFKRSSLEETIPDRWNLKFLGVDLAEADGLLKKVPKDPIEIADSGLTINDNPHAGKKLKRNDPKSDEHGHGTSIVGLIASKDFGINPNLKVSMNKNLLGSNGFFSPDGPQVDAIKQNLNKILSQNKKSTVSLSLTLGEVLSENLDSLLSADSFVVISSGNAREINDINSQMHERWRQASHENIFEIGSLSPLGLPAIHTNHAHTVDYYLPGSHLENLNYDYQKNTKNSPASVMERGTSYAAPQFAALVHTMRGMLSGISPSQLRKILDTTSFYKGHFQELKIANLYGALHFSKEMGACLPPQKTPGINNVEFEKCLQQTLSRKQSYCAGITTKKPTSYPKNSCAEFLQEETRLRKNLFLCPNAFFTPEFEKQEKTLATFYDQAPGSIGEPLIEKAQYGNRLSPDLFHTPFSSKFKDELHSGILSVSSTKGLVGKDEIMQENETDTYFQFKLKRVAYTSTSLKTLDEFYDLCGELFRSPPHPDHLSHERRLYEACTEAMSKTLRDFKISLLKKIISSPEPVFLTSGLDQLYKQIQPKDEKFQEVWSELTIKILKDFKLESCTKNYECWNHVQNNFSSLRHLNFRTDLLAKLRAQRAVLREPLNGQEALAVMNLETLLELSTVRESEMTPEKFEQLSLFYSEQGTNSDLTLLNVRLLQKRAGIPNNEKLAKNLSTVFFNTSEYKNQLNDSSDHSIRYFYTTLREDPALAEKIWDSFNEHPDLPELRERKFQLLTENLGGWNPKANTPIVYAEMLSKLPAKKRVEGLQILEGYFKKIDREESKRLLQGPTCKGGVYGYSGFLYQNRGEIPEADQRIKNASTLDSKDLFDRKIDYCLNLYALGDGNHSSKDIKEKAVKMLAMKDIPSAKNEVLMHVPPTLLFSEKIFYEQMASNLQEAEWKDHLPWLTSAFRDSKNLSPTDFDKAAKLLDGKLQHFSQEGLPDYLSPSDPLLNFAKGYKAHYGDDLKKLKKIYGELETLSTSKKSQDQKNAWNFLILTADGKKAEKALENTPRLTKNMVEYYTSFVQDAPPHLTTTLSDQAAEYVHHNPDHKLRLSYPTAIREALLQKAQTYDLGKSEYFPAWMVSLSRVDPEAHFFIQKKVDDLQLKPDQFKNPSSFEKFLRID